MAVTAALAALLIWASVAVQASTPRKGAEEEGCRQRRQATANLFPFPRVGKRLSLDYPVHIFPIIRWGHRATKKTSEAAHADCAHGLWFGPRLGRKRNAAEDTKDVTTQGLLLEDAALERPTDWDIKEYEANRDAINYGG